MQKIIHNRIRCKHCNDIVESKSRHDFVSCSCGKVFVDGGHDYCRWGFPSGNPEDHIEDLCEFEEEYIPENDSLGG